MRKRKKREKWEELRQVTALELHFCHHAEILLLSKAPRQPAKNKDSPPIVPIESNITAGLEAQSFLQALSISWPISKSWTFATVP